MRHDVDKPVLPQVSASDQRGARGQREPMAMWAVYENPSDRPGMFVARCRQITGGPEPVPTNQTVESTTLEGVRSLLPTDLHRIPRSDHDDAVIVETWV